MDKENIKALDLQKKIQYLYVKMKLKIFDI